LNRKEAIIVSVLVLATFVGSVFAENSTPNSPMPTLTPQTTSVDIEAFQAETNGLLLLA
jgi:hypothetical protein